jgi:hypothetical protein
LRNKAFQKIIQRRLFKKKLANEKANAERLEREHKAALEKQQEEFRLESQRKKVALKQLEYEQEQEAIIRKASYEVVDRIDVNEPAKAVSVMSLYQKHANKELKDQYVKQFPRVYTTDLMLNLFKKSKHDVMSGSSVAPSTLAGKSFRERVFGKYDKKSLKMQRKQLQYFDQADAAHNIFGF